MITHLQQPEDSKVCGQTVVAMAAGVSIDDVVKLMGHNHGTHTGDLVKAFANYGIEAKSKGLIRLNESKGLIWHKLPDFALLHVRFDRKGEPFHGHWVLWWDRILHDPGYSIAEVRASDGRITSYMELIPPVAA